MFGRFRKLLFAGAIGSAVGIPYLTAGGRGLDAVKKFFASSGQPAAPALNATDDSVATALAGLDPGTRALLSGQDAAAREIAPPQGLAEVFRFDITIDWIMQRWPTVSMVSSDLKQQGYRVPLVTGINEDDIAGSLTYYFGSDRQVQRITFEGVTGNADRLIRDVATPYGLERTQSTDAGLFLYRRNGWGKSESELKIRPAELISRTNPNRRFQISMVLTLQTDSWF